MAKNETYVSQFYLEIDGTPAPNKLINNVIEIVVEDNLHLPDMFVIQLHDRSLEWTNSDLFELGKAVKISAQAPDPRSRELGPQTVLIEGEITGLEPDILETGVPTLVVRGYDRAYRLHQGRRTRSFLQSTDSEIVQRLGEEVRLNTGGVQATETIYEQVVQSNQTNMDFLLERARRLGFDLYVEGETLYFGPAKNGDEPGPTLRWGLNLLSFRPNLSIVHQVAEVVVRSWDPQVKREIVARAAEPTSQPEVESRQRAKSELLGSQLMVSYPVHNQAEAEALAQGMRDEIGGELIQAEGVCLGEPAVAAGKMVQIEGLGSQFDGQYFVTGVVHTYNASEAYQTHFTIGGRQPQTLSALLAPARHIFEPGYGVVVGIVTNNQDPEGLGRIKVRYPALDDIDESPWVRPVAPMAGEKRGFFALPEVNDEVLITFEQGSIQRPYMLGMLWNGVDKPPRPSQEVLSRTGQVNQRLIRSRSGHEIILDDTRGQEQVIIADQAGNKITMKQGTMSIEVQGNLEINASGSITLKGTSIDLN